MVRAPFFDKNGLKKGAWNAEEDSKLRAYVQRYGHWNWRELPKFAGLSRCGKSCRLRWMNYLRPEVKHGNYTVEEEDLILKLHQKLGNKWSIIAANLPGRTDNEVKNHWHTHLSKREKINSTSEVKEQSTSIEISQCEANQSRECEAESFLANTSSHPILESSSLSPETSSTEFSSMSSDHAPVSSVNREDSLNTWETFEISSGDFWTQPFVADNTHNQDGYPLSLAGGEFISPFVSYYDNDIDLFY